MIKAVVYALAVFLIGVVSAVIGFIAVVNLGLILAPDLVLFGKEGYEATGPIGFILGALIGLIGSYALLFGKRTAK